MFLLVYSNAKIILKIERVFFRVMITDVLPPFFGSQCTYREADGFSLTTELQHTAWVLCDGSMQEVSVHVTGIFIFLSTARRDKLMLFPSHTKKSKRPSSREYHKSFYAERELLEGLLSGGQLSLCRSVCIDYRGKLFLWPGECGLTGASFSRLLG